MSDVFVLLDSPDDGWCEEFGWASTDATEDEARDALSQYCANEDGDVPFRPGGPATKVMLAPDKISVFEDEWRWHPVDKNHPEAQEFWQIDVTA